MEIQSPFGLNADSGELSLYDFQARLRPGLSVSEFQDSDLFPFATMVTHYREYDPGYQINCLALQDGRWVYIFTGFKDKGLVRIGFGWGLLRDGFQEMTKYEFEQQLHSYKAWLESALGPSLPCRFPISYYQEFRWGRIEASTDQRTNLAGIGICFDRV